MINPGQPNNLQTLMSQLLSGNYAPTGIATAPPQSPGAAPGAAPGAGLLPPFSLPGADPGLQQIWPILQSLMQMFGGQGPGAAASPAPNFLSSLLSQFMGPAGSGATPPAAGAGQQMPAGAPAGQSGQSGILGGSPSSAGPTPQTP